MCKQMTGIEYRSYFMSTLYGPLANLLNQDASTQGTWIGTYGTQGYDIVAGPISLPAGDTVTPSGQSTYTWTATTHATPRPAGSRLVQPDRRRLVLRHQLQRRRQPRRRAAARPRAVLRRLGQPGPGRDGADQRRGVGPRPEHADDLVVPVGRVPGLRGQRHIVITITRTAGANAVLNGLFLDPSSTAMRRRRGRGDAGDVDRHLRRPGLRHRRRPASLPGYATVTALGPVDLHLDRRPRPTPAPAGPRLVEPRRRRLVLAHQLHASTSTSPTAQAHDLELYFDDWDNKGRAETVQISDAATGVVLSTQTISSFQSGVYLNYAVSGHIVITITRTAGVNAVLNGLFLDPSSTATAVRQDASTQGTWIGTYGARATTSSPGPISLPAGDTVTPSGQSTYTWTATTTDPRALQVPGSLEPRRRRLVLLHQLHRRRQPHRRRRRTTSSCTSTTGTTRAGPRRCRSATRRRAPC